MKRKRNPQFSAKSLICEPGDLVVGIRGGKLDNYVLGTFVDHYYTLNNGFRNYASRIKRLSDSKVVSFQLVRKIESLKTKQHYIKMAAAWKVRFAQLTADRKKHLERVLDAYEKPEGR